MAGKLDGETSVRELESSGRDRNCSYSLSRHRPRTPFTFVSDEEASLSLGSVLIGLQASRKDGRGVTTKEFVAPLEIRSGEVEGTRADGGAWASGMVYFDVVRLSDFDQVDKSNDAGAQIEAFFSAIGDAFRRAARFLDQRSPSVTASMRATGISLQLFVEVRMDQDQMELELPAEFMAACGRHGIKAYVISNDISAHEACKGNEGLTNG